ncbi:zinc-binding dehydrogenase [Streptomyces kebangsaanensis]|uniref:Zinc-binding dehydrogenase n=1 Tax=Streptomyces kebangsaanensis TaxID=864058 RepID=A0ABW6KVI8_9ACTN
MAVIGAGGVQNGRLRRACAFGATDVVNSATADAVAAVRELTGGGVRHAFDVVGVAATAEQALRMTFLGGDVHVVGLDRQRRRAEALPATAAPPAEADPGADHGVGHSAAGHSALRRVVSAGAHESDDLVSRQIALDEIDAGYAALRNPEVARVVITSFRDPRR